MKCLKCGRETDQTFCGECREEMEKYPVKPGAILLLPKERPSAAKQSPRHTPTPPEVIVTRQQRLIRRLSCAFASLLVLLVLLGILTVRLLKQSAQPPLGQNYNTVTRPPAESTAAEASADADAIAPAELEDFTGTQGEGTRRQAPGGKGRKCST